MRSTYSKWVNIVVVSVVVGSLITACKLQYAMRGGNGNGSVVVGACAVTVVAAVAELVKVDAIVKESANAGLEHETKC